VVAAPPDIDASNAGWLRAVLLEAAARGDATFVVDMTATAAARPPRRRRRTKPGMRARADRPPRDPGASTSPA
jgi:hypothetical protein